jgi:hypothetical protein
MIYSRQCRSYKVQSESEFFIKNSAPRHTWFPIKRFSIKRFPIKRFPIKQFPIKRFPIKLFPIKLFVICVTNLYYF